ncbi:MAG: polyhydroxyalkanoate synthesis repressor PhaR [Rickettsiales bacterium]|nr:polyhydroxyalkanoate synthesis repressor PhaR [Rickettsiales bacterium]
MSATKSSQTKKVIIKKYANRRLYNTETSCYITLDDVSQMVKEGTDFIVSDAKTGDDLTRQILAQIIFELEMQGRSMMPVGFLKRMITLYDNSVGDFLPHYLERSMESFTENQEKIRQYMDETWGGYNAIGKFEEISRQNMEMFQSTFKMFNPFEAYFATGDKRQAPKDPKKS